MRVKRITSFVLFVVCAVGIFATAALAKDSPVVMLLIDEKNLGTIATAEVESMAVAMLLHNKVNVIDRDMVRANMQKDQQLMKMVGDDRGAASLGLQFGADIVIVGEAVAKPSARRIADSNLRTYQAVTTVRAVSTAGARTLASASEVGKVIGLDDVEGGSSALKKSGRKTLEKLIQEMLKAWHGGGQDAKEGDIQHVVITVGGVDQVWKLKSIRTMLRNNPELKNVAQRSYTAGIAVFAADSAVLSEELAENLVLKHPEKIRFQVLGIEKGKISLRAVAD